MIQRPILILATDLYFHVRFLFQPIIGPTNDSFMKDSFLLQNYGPDPPDSKCCHVQMSCFLQLKKIISI